MINEKKIERKKDYGLSPSRSEPLVEPDSATLQGLIPGCTKPYQPPPSKPGFQLTFFMKDVCSAPSYSQALYMYITETDFFATCDYSSIYCDLQKFNARFSEVQACWLLISLGPKNVYQHLLVLVYDEGK